ncbi:MAG: chitobiase/beta-hexosaminidase C-terminal domain-containing protein [Bacteroidota bacterium]
MRKTSLLMFMVIITIAVNAQMKHYTSILEQNTLIPVATLEQEQAAPFSYPRVAIDALGFPDSPEAMAVTDGGHFSSFFTSVLFKYGTNLQPAAKRVVSFKDGYLPIMQYTLKDGDIEYNLEAFSAPLEYDPQKNLITHIRWNIINTGNKDREGAIGLSLLKPMNYDYYCTPWFSKACGYESSFLEGKGEYISESDGTITKNQHIVLFNNKLSELSDGNQSLRFNLSPGETKTFTFKYPYVPVNKKEKEQIKNIVDLDYELVKNDVINKWNKEFESMANFYVPEKKVQDAFMASYVHLLIARDILEDGKRVTQRDHEFHYDYFYVRTAAYYISLYNMLGRPDIARSIVDHFFIYDSEGKPMEFRSRTGIHNKLCDDYWGQVLWGIGCHYKHTEDKELLDKVFSGQGYGNGWSLISNHIDEFERAIKKDSLQIYPAAWPYDNERVNGHYTGHNFWSLLGLKNAIELSRANGEEEWVELYEYYKSNVLKQLEKVTSQSGGYISPGLDDPHEGYDWANASAGLYPFEAIDKNHPAVKATLETIRNYGYQEGVSTYSVRNALCTKELTLAGNPDTLRPVAFYQSTPKEKRWSDIGIRKIHHYETFYVTESNLVIGEQQKVIEDLYGILVHTSSTHTGFEWGVTPWSTRDNRSNRPPHIWMAQRYMELIRNMLVREEGNDVHLLSAISPEWVKEGEKIEVKSAPTYYGYVSYVASFGKRRMNIKLQNEWRTSLNKVYFHLPWFMVGPQVSVDGKQVQASETIEIPKETKEIVVTWDNINSPKLSFDEAVSLFLEKFHNRPEKASYSFLFPRLEAPMQLKTEDSERISLYSPDNYAPVYYTIDGTQPTEKSKKYTKSIPIKKIQVLKAVCIDKDGNISDTLILN